MAKRLICCLHSLLFFGGAVGFCGWIHLDPRVTHGASAGAGFCLCIAVGFGALAVFVEF